MACVPHALNGKPRIAEGHGSAGRRPDGPSDFYHNSGFRADGSLDEAYATRLASIVGACDVLIVHAGDLVRKVETLRARPWYIERPRPILTNEAHGEPCFEAMLRRGVSFGLHSTTFQTMYPPRWGGEERYKLVFRAGEGIDVVGRARETLLLGKRVAVSFTREGKRWRKNVQSDSRRPESAR